ncbi:predicted protein [Nematostella vectensis]|uniref:DUF6729 domain-containing protein n=1 Tax=Nematostella vectensis TaxID=45351 RepID=A7SE15_NEMVE|nr:predicted protein [Nematostella vectensis]|eukprot:XP_001630072.1 predicted protein [Nematostella vectensis]
MPPPKPTFRFRPNGELEFAATPRAKDVAQLVKKQKKEQKFGPKLSKEEGIDQSCPFVWRALTNPVLSFGSIALLGDVLLPFGNGGQSEGKPIMPRKPRFRRNDRGEVILQQIRAAAKDKQRNKDAAKPTSGKHTHESPIGRTSWDVDDAEPCAMADRVEKEQKAPLFCDLVQNPIFLIFGLPVGDRRPSGSLWKQRRFDVLWNKVSFKEYAELFETVRTEADKKRAEKNEIKKEKAEASKTSVSPKSTAAMARDVMFGKMTPERFAAKACKPTEMRVTRPNIPPPRSPRLTATQSHPRPSTSWDVDDAELCAVADRVEKEQKGVVEASSQTAPSPSPNQGQHLPQLISSQPPKPDCYFAQPLLLWMPRKLWKVVLKCPQAGCNRNLTSAGLYQKTRQVVDIDGNYNLADEYLECGQCKKKVISWSPAIVENEARARVREAAGDASNTEWVLCKCSLQFGIYRGKTFIWLLSNDCGWAVMVLASHETKNAIKHPQGDSQWDNKEALRRYPVETEDLIFSGNQLEPCHCESARSRPQTPVPSDPDLQYLTECAHYNGAAERHLVSRPNYEEPPTFNPPPKYRWLLSVYALDIMNRMDQIKASITSTFGTILKMDSTKKIVKKLSGHSAGTAAWCTNIGNENGHVENEARARVREAAGDASNTEWVLCKCSLQFGIYRGKTFIWLLSNDCGWAVMVLASHETKRAIKHPQGDSQWDNKEALRRIMPRKPRFRRNDRGEVILQQIRAAAKDKQRNKDAAKPTSDEHPHEYLTECAHYNKAAERHLVSRPNYEEPPTFNPPPKYRWLLSVYALYIMNRMDQIKASITSTFGTILKMDSTKKIVKKLSGHSAGTAAWCTNIGNENGHVLMSVLTATERQGLQQMANGLMRRYSEANVPPPSASLNGVKKSAKRSVMIEEGILDPSEADVIRRITRNELALHCRRKTRAVARMSNLISALLDTFSGDEGCDTLVVPLLNNEYVNEIWESQ